MNTKHTTNRRIGAGIAAAVAGSLLILTAGSAGAGFEPRVERVCLGYGIDDDCLVVPTADGAQDAGGGGTRPAVAPSAGSTVVRGDAKDHPLYGSNAVRGDAKDHPLYGPVDDADRANQSVLDGCDHEPLNHWVPCPV
jgi:hypothetical protein